MEHTAFEVISISSEEVKDKIDAISFGELLNDNLDLNDYGTGLTKVGFTFVGKKPDDQPIQNEAEYDPIQKKISLKLNLNYYQIKSVEKNDVSKVMATLFLNSIDVYKQLEVPEFEFSKFYRDLEGLFFRRGLLLFE